ncbi:hypothetical protein AnigIFM49718_011170 [Aspergillus niger]|nr:hypothetical protein AnigIFM49718_011170 [Aspergillus niger]
MTAPGSSLHSIASRCDRDTQNLALVDMNPSCLQKSAARIDYPSKTAYLRCSCCIVCSANRTQAHCICESKTSLDSEGTLFGATILGYGAQHYLLGRLTMRLYNWKGILGNADDSPEVFVKALEDEFEEVETHVVGVVLLFRARKPRLALD